MPGHQARFNLGRFIYNLVRQGGYKCLHQCETRFSGAPA